MELIHSTESFLIFFGDYQTSPFSIETLKKTKIGPFEKIRSDQIQVLENKLIEQYKKLNSTLKINNLYFLNQIHGNNGRVLESKTNLSLKNTNFDSFEGDFLITNQKDLGIGVLTADCLPIIYYDSKNSICAIAHAGWRGTVKNIAIEVINEMRQKFNTKKEDLQIFFGPCAKNCCYEVNEDFHLNINDSELIKKTIIIRNNKNFFDLPLYNQTLIQNFEINNINFKYNICTICNPQFCSYRRDKEKSGLQMTIVTIK